MRLSAIHETSIQNILRKVEGPGERMLTASGKRFTGTGHEVHGRITAGDRPILHSHPSTPIPSAIDIESVHKAWSEVYERTGNLDGLFHIIKGNKEYKNYVLELKPDPQTFNPKANIRNLARQFEKAIQENDTEEATKILSKAGFVVLAMKI